LLAAEQRMLANYLIAQLGYFTGKVREKCIVYPELALK
jgi:hypothetical protein